MNSKLLVPLVLALSLGSPLVDAAESNQIKSNQIKSNQIKSNQIKSNQIKSNQIKSNQIKSNQIKSNQHVTATFKTHDGKEIRCLVHHDDVRKLKGVMKGDSVSLMSFGTMTKHSGLTGDGFYATGRNCGGKMWCEPGTGT